MKTYLDPSSKGLQESGRPSTAFTRLVGILLITGAIGVPTLLILHDQLNIDEESAALAFATYQQHQLPVFLTYYALMAAGVLFLLLAPLLYALYARLQTPLRLMVLICMLLAGGALAVASSRWLIVLPYLAQIYTNPQTGAATRVALDVAYKGTSYFLGITISEFFYNIFTGMWSIFLATMLLRSSRRKAWFHWIGIIGGATMLIGSFEQIFASAGPGPVFRQILIAGIVAWMIWLVWLAISLLIKTSETRQQESHFPIESGKSAST
ncbi:MAG TPA: DUF4386 family protein [Ktedonobacteraceae bacterium]